MSEPLISVIVPTYNRADLLRRVLHAMNRQSLDAALYEIIVVDNNCTDSTASVVARAARAHGNVRSVPAPEQGLSHAKNAGLQAAAGEIVAYTDDDAMPCSDWLSLIADSFTHVSPRPHVVGGPTYPLFIGRRPAWFRDSYETFSWGDSRRFLSRGECFFGLNVAFRRAFLTEAGGFDTSLGMRGESLGFDEDDEVFERLWAHAGGRLYAYYEPAAFVRHAIPESRATATYRLRRQLVNGQTRFDRQQRGRSRRRLDEVAKAGLFFSWAVVRAVDRRATPDRGDWLVQSADRVGDRLGFFLAALGIRVSGRRAG